MYHDPTREILIDMVGWYDLVNTSGMVSIDDLAKLKTIVAHARGMLYSASEPAQYWLLDFEGDKDQFDDTE